MSDFGNLGGKHRDMGMTPPSHDRDAANSLRNIEKQLEQVIELLKALVAKSGDQPKG
jgi:hypothetical protein